MGPDMPFFFHNALTQLGFSTPPGALQQWLEHTHTLLAHRGSKPNLSPLVSLWRWERHRKTILASPRALWPQRLGDLSLLIHTGPEATAQLLHPVGNDANAFLRLALREIRLERLHAVGDDALAHAFMHQTEDAIALLESLRDTHPTPIRRRVQRLFPELTALAAHAPRHASVEHEAPAGATQQHLPLLDHLTQRVLGRKLLGLERGELSHFQHDDALGPQAFSEELEVFERLRHQGMVPALRVALIYLDFAKGGDPAQRQHWRTRDRVDLSVHNTAARTLLERSQGLQVFPELRARPEHTELILALIESHGLTGQALRGETPWPFLAPWIRFLRRSPHLADAARDALHLVNLCDTAGVREGLMTGALRDEMQGLEAHWCAIALAHPEQLGLHAIEAELANAERARWEALLPNASSAQRQRARLTDRLARLRAGRLRAGESRADLVKLLESLEDASIAEMDEALALCQFWYAEVATSALAPRHQLEVLLLGACSARAHPDIEPERPFHVSLRHLMRQLHEGDPRAFHYRIRLIEALLENTDVASILALGEGVLHQHALGTLEVRIGGDVAVALSLEESAEASALLTLLPIYESKSSAAFHSTLKTLCDLYGLRKDAFDRVANEALYLVHMNSARSDKARMLDYAVPGRIVEVGPGGGVVLDLLEDRFPESEILGIDISQMVIEALTTHREREGRRWQLIHADAFAMPEVLEGKPVDTVVFCSLLHEIYSYVEHEGERFQLAPVRELLRAAYRCLNPGGRIVIRDGIRPPDDTRILELIAPDARELLDLFCEQFEGRPITYEALPDGRVKMSAADAMEFLYTYTWGPASFPYEIREQYGILTYREYEERLLAWLSQDPAHPPRIVELPEAQKSYLQDGYRTGLAPRVALFDGDGNRVELPDSNALLVVEKGGFTARVDATPRV